MLEELHVTNLAIIEETDIEFGKGLNILSGETGAGKSILLGALNMALGSKVEKSMLRQGATEAKAEIIFSVSKEEEERLKELDIACEDSQLILLRKVTEDKSVAKINGETVPASKLKAAAEILLDIHGQHDHQSLLAKRKHMEILDRYADAELGELKLKMKELYREYRTLEKELSLGSLGDQERKKQLDFLNYEISEIESANLKIGEDDELEDEYTRLSHAERIMESTAAASAELSNGGIDAIDRAMRLIEGVSGYDSELSELTDLLANAEELIDDANRKLRDYIDGMGYEKNRFDEVERRLDVINQLKLKHGRTIEIILEQLESKKAEADKLSDYDNYIAGLSAKVDSAKAELMKVCDEVSDIRKRAAVRLTDSIVANLNDLSFLEVQFEMEFAKGEFTENGYDDAQFMICTNPGEALRPLDKVASGGELSRIMLAIKCVLASEDEIGTMVFDEIDTGISGKTALAVASKLGELSKVHQIVCITHLPQIAAMADTHFCIEKSVQSSSTVSDIRRLTENETITELARMLGGDESSEAALANARELRARK